MLWDCDNCGVKQIAASLEECPVCHTPKPQEQTEPTPDVTAEPSAGTRQKAPGGPKAGASSEAFPAGDNADVPPSHEQEVQNGKDHV